MSELSHWGIMGMRWGIRRYQNEDGTLTEAGKKRYQKAGGKDDWHYKSMMTRYHERRAKNTKNDKWRAKHEDLARRNSEIDRKMEDMASHTRYARGFFMNKGYATVAAMRNLISRDGSYGRKRSIGKQITTSLLAGLGNIATPALMLTPMGTDYVVRKAGIAYEKHKEKKAAEGKNG